ncbi:MAG TPA: ATP-binding protein, partial [Ktedonobacteraceae bacterium]
VQAKKLVRWRGRHSGLASAPTSLLVGRKPYECFINKLSLCYTFSMSQLDYQQLFSRLLESIPFPLFIVDRDLVIRHLNRPALLLVEKKQLEQGIRLDRILPDPVVLDLVLVCIQTYQSQHRIYERRSSPESTWKISVMLLTEQKQAGDAPETDQLFSVAIEDVTESVRWEHMQRDFLANISHELRTPITSVRLLAETLEDVIDTDPNNAQLFVEKIEKEVQYLADMVAELMELSRIESGQLPITIEPVEAGQLVHEALARMLPQAQRHRVRLSTDIQQGNRQVAVDSKLIARVLTNLVHNAIKFTPSGGRIVLGTAYLSDQQMQKFFVRDTGIGIPEEDLPRVFERFYKVSRSRSKDAFVGAGGGGSGLGLAIARQVIEAHGGKIKAESTPGTGSTFTFTLPVAKRLHSD